MFEQRSEDLIRKARDLYKQRADVHEFAQFTMNSFTSAETIVQQADRLITLIMYEKTCEEIEAQVVELLMQLIITMDLVDIHGGEKTCKLQ